MHTIFLTSLDQTLVKSNSPPTTHCVLTAKIRFCFNTCGYFEKPKWKLVENISPTDYLNEAKSWVSNGAQIIGGCCGVGPDLIKAISNLK